MAERVSPALRRLVERRAGHRCEYCQTPARFVPETLSVEHIIPRSRLGSDSAGNLALACQGCNNHKYIRIEAEDPVTGLTVRFSILGANGGRPTLLGARTEPKCLG